MSIITQIAEAVKDELNNGSFSQTLVAERAFRPRFTQVEMKNRHVSVVAKALSIQATTRTSTQQDVQIDIAIQQKYTEGDAAELDPLMALVEEIADFFKQKSLAGYPNAVWTKIENNPIYAVEHMDELRQFTSVLTLTYRVIR